MIDWTILYSEIMVALKCTVQLLYFAIFGVQNAHFASTSAVIMPCVTCLGS